MLTSIFTETGMTYLEAMGNFTGSNQMTKLMDSAELEFLKRTDTREVKGILPAEGKCEKTYETIEGKDYSMMSCSYSDNLSLVFYHMDKDEALVMLKSN